MRPIDRRGGHSRRRSCPSLEGLEARALLSVAATDAGPAQPVGQVLQPATEINLPPTSKIQVDPALLPGFVNTLYPPTVTTTTTTVITAPDNAPGQVGQTATYTSPPGTYSTPQPTPAEVRRQEFVVKFTGRYVVGPPRFSDQAATIHIYSDGKNAGSNQYLHGRAQIILFTPADPNAQPTTADPVAGQTEGLAVLFEANFLQSSDAEFFDASTPTGVAANDPAITDHGLPSHLDLTLDTVGSGLYTTPAYTTTPAITQVGANGQAVAFGSGVAGAVAYSQGTGVMDIQYHPDNRLKMGGTSSGTCTVTIQGLINLSGVFNALSKDIN